MDAVQFGRWLSERRHQCGFASQRVLAACVERDPVVGKLGITEDFLARLETGKFAHPFRGVVRKRVLALTWYLCRTPRDVKAYMRAAELGGLDADEVEQVQLLYRHLMARRNRRRLPLPPRPARLIGRESTIQALVESLCSMDGGLYAITGMSGIGKSALAAEVIHRLATNERQCLQFFPDGIASFTCTGHHGNNGLIALLDDIASMFSAPVPVPSGPGTVQEIFSYRNTTSPGDTAVDLARMIDRARLVLSDKRVLLLLDDVEPELPLRQLVEAVLPQNPHAFTPDGDGEIKSTCSTVLLTSRFIPPAGLVAHHLHLEPLEPDAALEHLLTLIGRPLGAEEVIAARNVCALVGYLPLALEVVATAVAIKGIPLALLAAYLSTNPLDDVLDGEQVLRSRMSRALGALDAEKQKHFALLSTLGVQSFGLESAAAIHPPAAGQAGLTSLQATHDPRVGASFSAPAVSSNNSAHAGETAGDDEVAHRHLMRIATHLGQFVQHSLIDLAPADEPRQPARQHPLYNGSGMRYRLHPLLYAYAQNELHRFEQEEIEAAIGNVQAYALTYLERYKEEIPRLEHESELLFASLVRVRAAGQHAQVVRFVERLAPIASRLRNPGDGKRLFLWGIQASQDLHDCYHQARFLNGLGQVYFERGEYETARQLWIESLDMAASAKQTVPMNIWVSLSNLADLAGLFGEYDSALRYSEMYLKRYQQSSEAIRTADAHYCYAAFARLQGNLDAAYASAASGKSIMAQYDPLHLSPVENFIGLRVQAELERILGDYAASQAIIDQAADLMQERGCYYFLADLLFDQASFARQQKRYADGRQLASRVIHIAKQARLPHFQQRGTLLLEQLSEMY